jgi:hypothetical protein
MRLSSTASATAATLLALFWGTPAPAGDEFRDGYGHYTFTLPTGWGEAPLATLSAINSAAKHKVRDMTIKYDHAFLGIGEKWGNFPYVLVQSIPTPSGEATYDDIEKSLSAFGSGVKRAEGKFADLVKGTSVGDVSFDRTNNRVTFRLQMEVSGVGKVQALGFGFIGKKQIIFLHCYDREEDFQRRTPVFLKLADSFKFEPGYEFVAAQPRTSVLSGGFSGVLPIAIIGAAIGGFVGLAFVIISFLTKKPAEEEPIDLAPYQDD